MDVVLVPGLWLDASSWQGVADRLSAAGHVPHPLTMHGLDSRTADRRGTMLADHVAHIVSTIDVLGGPVALVGHAESCGLIHAAVNRRPHRIARAVHVGGFPSSDGAQLLSGFTKDPRGAVVLTGGHRAVDSQLAALYARRSESTAQALDQVQHLTDERRYAVPITVVATEFTADDVRRWMAADIDPVRELVRTDDVTLVDLPAGRWPQIERADELAQLLISSLGPVRAETSPAAAGG